MSKLIKRLRQLTLRRAVLRPPYTKRGSRRKSQAMNLFVSLTLLGAAYLLSALSTAGRAVADTRADLSVRGQIIAKDQTTLSSHMAGQIIKLSAKDGNRINKGDLLAAYECNVQRAQHAEASAAHDAAKHLAAINARLNKLKSAADVELAMAVAEEKKMAARLAALAATIEHCEIKAPFSGRVSAVLINNFQYVKSGQPLFELINDQQFGVEFLAPSSRYRAVLPGAAFKIKVHENGVIYNVKIERLGGKIDAVSRTIKVYGEILNPTKTLISGMTGRVIINDLPKASNIPKVSNRLSDNSIATCGVLNGSCASKLTRNAKLAENDATQKSFPISKLYKKSKPVLNDASSEIALARSSGLVSSERLLDRTSAIPKALRPKKSLQLRSSVGQKSDQADVNANELSPLAPPKILNNPVAASSSNASTTKGLGEAMLSSNQPRTTKLRAAAVDVSPSGDPNTMVQVKSQDSGKNKLVVKAVGSNLPMIDLRQDPSVQRPEDDGVEKPKKYAAQPLSSENKEQVIKEAPLKILVQKELKRLGCYNGVVDGVWGRKSQLSLAQFNAATKLEIPEVLTKGHMTQLAKIKKIVCRRTVRKRKTISSNLSWMVNVWDKN